ncbi:magnesium transporter CorA family protein [Butyrivibrio sp. AE2032]|uniref:magnesium transporter CorA family protein n=1 Tax=Butyrivibrio sp. AE2032 TaxID=1458463 RepID=UPI000556BCBC|nr:CorA family divalent cation transporter [Butyrivibrio sp. AE2032]
MYFLIEETLKKVAREDIKGSRKQYVAVLTSEEWKTKKDSFEMGIDIDPDITDIYTTKAEVNYDSLTGTFAIPDRKNPSGDDMKFAFVLDEKGIVFIDDHGTAMDIINGVQRTKKWKMPSLERFLYDFLDQIVRDDLRLMEKYEDELDSMEKQIIEGDENLPSGRLNDIRNDIRYLRIHYEQLIDLAQELEENENGFFKLENLRYFRLFINRAERLHEESLSLRDYTMQLRDLYKAHLDIKQNRIMTVLTVVTTIFMPLTLIVGWYGMNFVYMPELKWEWSYPVVIIASVVIVIASLLFFKKKKWL